MLRESGSLHSLVVMPCGCLSADVASPTNESISVKQKVN